MITEAISTLKERNGSSQQAIAKFIDEKHGKVLPPNFKKLLSVQLKKFVKSERLFKAKNSFKISPAEQKKKKDPKPIAPKEKLKSAEKIPVSKEAKKAVKKTKRLSQVKTPEALKRKTGKPIDYLKTKGSKRARN